MLRRGDKGTKSEQASSGKEWVQYIRDNFGTSLVDKDPPASGEDGDQILGLGRSHETQLQKPVFSGAGEPQWLSPHAATTEARVPRAWLCNKRSHRKKATHPNKD